MDDRAPFVRGTHERHFASKTGVFQTAAGKNSAVANRCPVATPLCRRDERRLKGDVFTATERRRYKKDSAGLESAAP
jgi:hypothetical protein